MKTLQTRLLLLSAFCIFIFSTAKSQDDGFIYGKIYTIDGTAYEGAIRWGKEEVFWTDHFNASKEENENIKYLSREERDELDNRKMSGWASQNPNWFERNFVNTTYNWIGEASHIHQFVCEFGEIASIRPTGRSSATLTMRNGEAVYVDGSGYNDIGTKIKIIDPEIGVVDLMWDRVEKVEFINTPKKLKDKFGEPLYGTVETSIGKFTGFVQWDHDERVDTDKLDGSSDDGKISLEFGKIQRITRMGSSRCEVITQSGRKLVLSNSNDVNSGNRGIIVNIEGVGRVDIPWKEFESVTFTNAPGSGLAYNKYGKQEKLFGTVNTKIGEILKGEIVFDLDEAFNYEVLHGELDGIEMIIPFRYIKSILPKNYNYSEVKLKTGESYVLGYSQDVSDKNTGALVFKSKTPKYIVWEDISEIIF